MVILMLLDKLNCILSLKSPLSLSHDVDQQILAFLQKTRLRSAVCSAKIIIMRKRLQ